MSSMRTFWVTVLLAMACKKLAISAGVQNPAPRSCYRPTTLYQPMKNTENNRNDAETHRYKKLNICKIDQNKIGSHSIE